MEAPVGAQVDYVPDGAASKTIDGVTYFVHNDTYYRPYYSGSDVVYIVAERPEGAEQSLEEVQTTVTELLHEEELVLEEPAPQVKIAKFSPSYREMVARFWVDGTTLVAARFAVNERIDRAFAAAGISMAPPRLEVVRE